MRLTVIVRQQLLDQNEGFTRTTHDSQKNFTEDIKYTITGGELHMRRTGKSSWADSRFDENSIADVEQTRRFLRKYLDSLNTAGIE
ncbi:hypothetical protein ACIRO3_30160 [Streptomyces sp. NPDC102278]|uniref:hypothetical protein n=1 Tax=Streptomyces sp. NPDC102278 TaxID=3366152 RepID=UPI0037F1574C